jgi:UDP-glucose 4-epimerase
MTILVIGGAGYIGSHMVLQLSKAGHHVVVLDDLSTGFENAILGNARLVLGDVGDRALLDSLFSTEKFEGVLHFASLIQVGESVVAPARYYRSNVAKTLTLLEAMVEHDVGPLIFSSTAAVFGEPKYSPIDEAHVQVPINPYGASKYMVERMLEDFDRAYGLRSVALRYFNAAGADPSGQIGERHEPETHLIPLAIQAALGVRPPINIFGRDYPTSDGTCIRDYIHVTDLAYAHLKALDYLWAGNPSARFNLGNGNGFSIQEVLDTIERISGKTVPYKNAARRSGDPAELVADSNCAKRTLGWAPRYSDLNSIIAHAWEWEQKRGNNKI